MLVPSAEMDVILRIEIAPEPGLPLGLLLFQLTEQGSAVLRPETVVIDVAVIGRKQRLGGILRPVHDGGHLFFIRIQDRCDPLLAALFHHPDPYHLAPSVAHTVVWSDPGDGGTAAPTGFGDGDLILKPSKPPPVVFRLLPTAGTFAPCFRCSYMGLTYNIQILFSLSSNHPQLRNRTQNL